MTRFQTLTQNWELRHVKKANRSISFKWAHISLEFAPAYHLLLLRHVVRPGTGSESAAFLILLDMDHRTQEVDSKKERCSHFDTYDHFFITQGTQSRVRLTESWSTIPTKEQITKPASKRNEGHEPTLTEYIRNCESLTIACRGIVTSIVRSPAMIYDEDPLGSHCPYLNIHIFKTAINSSRNELKNNLFAILLNIPNDSHGPLSLLIAIQTMYALISSDQLPCPNHRI